jgi:hypothetical protein
MSKIYNKIEWNNILYSISNHTTSYKGNYIYLLDLGNNYYKFGRTANIISRLRNHFNKHKFNSIVKLWNCEKYISDIERCIKIYAVGMMILEQYKGETEIIKTNDISKVIDYVDIIATTLSKDNISDKEINHIIDTVLLEKELYSVLLIHRKIYKCPKCESDFATMYKIIEHTCDGIHNIENNTHHLMTYINMCFGDITLPIPHVDYFSQQDNGLQKLIDDNVLYQNSDVEIEEFIVNGRVEKIEWRKFAC